MKPEFGRFLETLREIGQSARKRSELGEGGDPVWSVEEWRAFCDAGQDYAETGGAFADGIFKTVRNVRTMLDDGKDARFIHRVFYWRGRKAEEDGRAEADARRQKEISEGHRDRERQIDAEKGRELIRLEARARAKVEFDAQRGDREQPRRRYVEGAL